MINSYSKQNARTIPFLASVEFKQKVYFQNHF